MDNDRIQLQSCRRLQGLERSARPEEVPRRTIGTTAPEPGAAAQLKAITRPGRVLVDDVVRNPEVVEERGGSGGLEERQCGWPLAESRRS